MDLSSFCQSRFVNEYTYMSTLSILLQDNKTCTTSGWVSDLVYMTFTLYIPYSLHLAPFLSSLVYSHVFYILSTLPSL